MTAYNGFGQANFASGGCVHITDFSVGNDRTISVGGICEDLDLARGDFNSKVSGECMDFRWNNGIVITSEWRRQNDVLLVENMVIKINDFEEMTVVNNELHFCGRQVADPEEMAFLRTLMDHPEDQLAADAYSDWLEEQGHEMAAGLVREWKGLDLTRLFSGLRTRLPATHPLLVGAAKRLQERLKERS
jgi:uncharacterized protein (TIGR02996 family)